MKDSRGSTLSTIKRPMINLTGDTWTVDIANHDVIDPRILVMIGAYKTSADKDRRDKYRRD